MWCQCFRLRLSRRHQRMMPLRAVVDVCAEELSSGVAEAHAAEPARPIRTFGSSSLAGAT